MDQRGEASQGDSDAAWLEADGDAVARPERDASLSDDETKRRDRPTPAERVGLAMLQARKTQGLRQIDVAEKMPYSRTSISEFERGKSLPTEDVVRSFEKALNLEPGTIKNIRDEALWEAYGSTFVKQKRLSHDIVRSLVKTYESKIEADALLAGQDIAKKASTDFEEEDSCAPEAGDTTSEIHPNEKRLASTWWRFRRRTLVKWAIAMTVITTLCTLCTIFDPGWEGHFPEGTICEDDSIALDAKPIYLPFNRRVGTLELRSSLDCKMIWAHFTGIEGLTKDTPTALFFELHRPADNLVKSSRISYDGKHGDTRMLNGGASCVFATIRVLQNGTMSDLFSTGCKPPQ